LRPLIQFARIA
jgi:predicted DNA-binding transcriptional regulator AlpA